MTAERWAASRKTWIADPFLQLDGEEVSGSAVRPHALALQDGPISIAILDDAAHDVK